LYREKGSAKITFWIFPASSF